MRLKISRFAKVCIEIMLLGLLVVLFIKVLDYQSLQQYITLITLRVVIGVLCFQLAILLLQTCQWHLIMREAGISRGLWRTFRARISGFSLTYLTPSMYFGGEPVRASLLKDNGMSYQKLYATIALDKYIELFTKLPCILVGFSLLIFLAHPSITLIIIAGAILLVFIAFFLFLMVKLFSGGLFIVGFVKRLLRPFARINPRFVVKIIRAVREFAMDLHEIISTKKIFYLAMLLGFAVSVVEVFQTFYILTILGHTYLPLPHSFVIFSTVVIQGLIGLLPGNLGGMEGTHLFIFNILWIGSSMSLVYTIILRIGQMTMVLLGILNIIFWRIVTFQRRGADRNRTDA
jgi:uncharacterized protein (TIRG00374 family)